MKARSGYFFFCILSFFIISFTTLHSQTLWTTHPGNPVIPNELGGGYALRPVVVYDNASNLYRMWFTAKYYGVAWWTIYYAVSADGISWFSYVKNPVLEGGSAAFESTGITDGCVIQRDSQYLMYYEGVPECCGAGFGLAFSTDGIHWTKYADNPILTPSSEGWDSAYIRAPKIYYDGSKYSMYYHGSNGITGHVGLATSADGFHWEKSSSNPVLTAGDSTAWDGGGIQPGAIVYDKNQFYLFYTGAQTDGPEKIGYAVSNDGIAWKKHPGNPVSIGGDSGNWDFRAGVSSVILKDGIFRMWYSGTTIDYPRWSIGYAESKPDTLLDVKSTNGMPQEFHLFQNYPNPFNPSTTIRYVLPVISLVTLKVYNILGQEILTLVNEIQDAGLKEVEWNAGKYASGVYFYHLQAGQLHETKKLVLVK